MIADTHAAADAAAERAQARRGEALPSSTRLDLALARIESSRASLRSVLVPAPPPASPPPRSPGERRFAAGWRHLRRRMREHPAFSVALHAADSWWQRQPLRPVIETTAGELRGAVSPWIRRHPVLAVSLAAGLAAALVLARPWRMPAVRAQLHGAPRRAGRWLWAQLTQAPVQSLLASLFVAAFAARQASEPERAPAPDDAAPAMPPTAPMPAAPASPAAAPAHVP
jgi:hypothetical protein